MSGAVRDAVTRTARAALVGASLVLSACAMARADEPPAPADPQAIVAYRESGEWSRDISSVIERARRVLARRVAGRPTRRPAIVLDIDDTALSSYACLAAVAFERSGAGCGARTNLPAIPQTRRLYRQARAQGVSVFFVTGRRERLRATTVANLRAAGYAGRWALVMRPDRERAGTHATYKATARRRIERRGHRILVNVGDQRSDLRGGHAARAFKLPNPMYVIP